MTEIDIVEDDKIQEPEVSADNQSVLEEEDSEEEYEAEIMSGLKRKRVVTKERMERLKIYVKKHPKHGRKTLVRKFTWLRILAPRTIFRDQ